VAAILLTWLNSKASPTPWLLIGRWALPILSAVFLVKEISSEVFLNAFIFLIVFTSTLSLKVKISSDSRVDDSGRNGRPTPPTNH
jgi:hypothetical protein